MSLDEMDPRRVMAVVELAGIAAFTRCPHCTPSAEMVGLADTAPIPVGLGITHEPGCPSADND